MFGKAFNVQLHRLSNVLDRSPESRSRQALEALLFAPAELIYPRRGAAIEFRAVLALPGAAGTSQRSEHSEPLDLS